MSVEFKAKAIENATLCCSIFAQAVSNKLSCCISYFISVVVGEIVGFSMSLKRCWSDHCLASFSECYLNHKSAHGIHDVFASQPECSTNIKFANPIFANELDASMNISHICPFLMGWEFYNGYVCVFLVLEEHYAFSEPSVFSSPVH